MDLVDPGDMADLLHLSQLDLQVQGELDLLEVAVDMGEPRHLGDLVDLGEQGIRTVCKVS